MNRMKEVAKALRVNLNEEFTIENEKGVCFLKEDGLFIKSDWLTTNEDTEKLLVELLMGEKKIIKKPFNPTEGQEFWCYDPFEHAFHGIHFEHSNLSHRILEDKQLIFRSEEEAKEYIEFMKNMLKEERGIPV